MFEEVLTRIGTSFAVAFTLSVFIERALAVLFAYRFYAEKLGGKGFKVPIAILVSYVICSSSGIDLIAVTVNEPASILGYVITALLVAGGAKKWGEIFGDLKQGAVNLKK